MKNVITALRNSDGCQAPWIFTLYCFVDFERRWSMVDNVELRCHDQLNNGAIYLESILRNIDIESFMNCWGDSWQIGFQSYLDSTKSGVEWWKAVQIADLSVDDEISYWKHYNISEYTTHWQNIKQLGVIETLTIQNSLSYEFELTLKHSNGSFQWSTQTSSKLYWGFASDLWAITSNTSVKVRNMHLQIRHPKLYKS
ncbi:hypothetical protein THRCLA_23414 [Thraustotheca clavata]|uniref:Uncharacterized protein n=1 Tax=Thraustotheca clavata TaxID=74557 RepID=A0A1V9Y5Y9_9STRA|nr:hypothetical protein THRCLA_23414 [Thraustotheca clavata]